MFFCYVFGWESKRLELSEMTALNAARPSMWGGSSRQFESGPSIISISSGKLRFLTVGGDYIVIGLEWTRRKRSLGLCGGTHLGSRFLRSIKAMEDCASISGITLFFKIIYFLYYYDQSYIKMFLSFFWKWVVLSFVC